MFDLVFSSECYEFIMFMFGILMSFNNWIDLIEDLLEWIFDLFLEFLDDEYDEDLELLDFFCFKYLGCDLEVL